MRGVSLPQREKHGFAREIRVGSKCGSSAAIATFPLRTHRELNFQYFPARYSDWRQLPESGRHAAVTASGS
jgi:hypothetical protein